MAEIKAIETIYNGYRFRSRLEARWAVFFDAIGMKYEYEVEGFKNDQGECYLPDFYLPDEDMYVEVKPLRDGATTSIQKAIRFVGGEIKNLLILPDVPKNPLDCDGDVGLWCFPVFFYHPLYHCKDYRFLPFFYDDRIEQVSLDRMTSYVLFGNQFGCEEQYNHIFAVCKGNIDYLLTPLPFGFGDVVCSYGKDNGDISEQEIVQEAYTKARQARFEHGEKG